MMSLSSNTWYSIQNFGNDFFVNCSNVGTCVTATDDLSAPELFQIATVNGSSSYYIRPKAQITSTSGEPYCVNIDAGEPAIAPCSNTSAIWGLQTWDEQSTRDGWYFYTLAAGDSQRMYLSDNETYSLESYGSSTPQSEQYLMQWGVSSRGVINDQSYSTVPAAITNSAMTTTTTITAPTDSTSASTSGITSSLDSTPAEPTSSSHLPTSISASPSESTLTMAITPTVTASDATSLGATQSSSVTVTPTLRNSAQEARMDLKLLLAVVIVLPQMLRFHVV